MNDCLLEILRCPNCDCRLSLETAAQAEPQIEDATLRCGGCSAAYPVVKGIPRFVPVDNYAASFGFQWNRFPRTQLDSYSGQTISADRFFGQSGWTKEQLSGKRVLDIGCGAGRFAEVALEAGAHVVAVDYSLAVEACRANHVAQSRLDVVQADVYRLPFAHESFDFVYCFGVLQHTPDVRRAFASLVPQVRKGGRLAVDLYPKLWTNVFWPKYWFRPITKRMRGERLFRLIERLVTVLLPLSRAVSRIPVIGTHLRWLVPVANYEGVHPLNSKQLYEWSVLDTFDMFAPAHDHPQDAATLQAWCEEEGLSSIEVFRRGHLVGRGVRQ